MHSIHNNIFSSDLINFLDNSVLYYMCAMCNCITHKVTGNLPFFICSAISFVCVLWKDSNRLVSGLWWRRELNYNFHQLFIITDFWMNLYCSEDISIYSTELKFYEWFFFCVLALAHCKQQPKVYRKLVASTKMYMSSWFRVELSVFMWLKLIGEMFHLLFKQLYYQTSLPHTHKEPRKIVK